MVLPHLARRLIPVAALTLSLPGCDKIPGLGGDDKSGEADDAAKTDAKDEDKDKDKDEGKDEDKDKDEDDDKDAKKDGEDEAKKAAEEEAAKKAAEEEAAKKAAEEAEKNLPIVLSEIDVKGRTGLRAVGSLDITAKGKLNKAIDSGTYVRAKVVCKHGERHIADVAYINADYTKPLQQFAEGETAGLKGLAFTQGVKEAMAPCQLDFKLSGGGSSTLAVDLRSACYDGSKTTVGPCDPPVAAAAMSGAGSPLEVHDLVVAKQKGFGSSSGRLDATYVLQVNTPQPDNARITLKAACEVGETKVVDMSHGNLMANPFKYESGESVARQASLFYNPAFGFAEPPGVCDVGVAVWTPVSGSFGEYDQEVLTEACYRDEKMTKGRCDPSAPKPGAPAPVSAESVSIDNVKLEIAEPYGSKGDRFQLKVEADAIVAKMVDQKASVQAKVTCKVGKTARVETAYLYGVELYYLEPGETTRLSSTTFASSAMDERPKSCEAEFTAGKRFAPSGETGVPLGKWCIKKDKVKACGGQKKKKK